MIAWYLPYLSLLMRIVAKSREKKFTKIAAHICTERYLFDSMRNANCLHWKLIPKTPNCQDLFKIQSCWIQEWQKWWIKHVNYRISNSTIFDCVIGSKFKCHHSVPVNLFMSNWTHPNQMVFQRHKLLWEHIFSTFKFSVHILLRFIGFGLNFDS